MSGISSLSQIDDNTLNSSFRAILLFLYCSMGTPSGPAAFPAFNPLTESSISSMDNLGVSGSSGPSRSTDGSSGLPANFLSKKSAQHSSWCSVVVIWLPFESITGCTEILDFCWDDNDFASLKTFVIFPAEFSASMSSSIFET